MKYIYKLFFSFVLVSFGSLNIYSQWVTQSSGVSTSLKQVIFYNQNTGWIAGAGGTILKTSNGGLLWNTMTSGTTQDLYSVTFRDSLIVLVCGANGTILRSTNGGTNWAQAVSGTTSILRSIATVASIFQPAVFAAGDNGTLLASTNEGINWSAQNSNTTRQINNMLFFFNGTSGYSVHAAGNNGTLKIGSAWTDDPTFPVTTENLTGSATNYADIYNILRFICTEGGRIFKVRSIFSNEWTQINSGVTSPLHSIHSQSDHNDFSGGKKVWAVGNTGIIRVSNDTGNTWSGQNSFTSSNLNSVFMWDSSKGWIVGDGGAVLNTINGGGPIGIQPIGSNIPSDYSLSQNYPNPFNPNSKIKFQIAKSGNVKLVVLDILGKEVATLVNEQLKPGTYETDFDGSKLSSGVYFYRLVVGDNINNGGFTETKKMLMIK